MALKKAPYWTDLYYSLVEHYFWRPQDIGRKAHPDLPSQPWAYWKSRLASQETPLNHILDLLFHISPQELLDQSVSALLERDVSNLELVSPEEGTLDDNIVQPDIIVSNGESLIFVEMKVDSKSSIDQFAKYAIAAHCILKDEPEIKRAELIILSRNRDHSKVWRSAKRKGLNSCGEIRELALKGLNDQSIWEERGVLRYLRNNPTSTPELSNLIQTMGLYLADYKMLDSALSAYIKTEKSIAPLVGGVLEEFRRRELT